MVIQYLGHACFRMVSGDYTVIIDPYAAGSVPGLQDLEEAADLCLCSHGHGDHHGMEGISVSGKECPFSVKGLGSWHDDRKGALRGSNTIHVIDADGVRAVHMGDIGCMPEEELLQEMNGTDVLMIPVGGHYTAAPETICDMIKRINPRMVFPMHFRSEKSGFDVIGTCEAFIELAEQRLGIGGEYAETDSTEVNKSGQDPECRQDMKILVLQQNKWSR